MMGGWMTRGLKFQGYGLPKNLVWTAFGPLIHASTLMHFFSMKEF